MSSLPRRLEIRGLKSRGYRRESFRLARDDDGMIRPVRVTRGGIILGPEPKNSPVGYHWPRVVDLRQAAAT